MAVSEYEGFDAERRRPLMSTRADVEEYLRGLYDRSMGEAPTSPVAAFSADMTPTPEALAQRPRFESMLEGYSPAINERRLQTEAEVEADRRSEEGLASLHAGKRQGEPLPGVTAGLRRPLPSAATAPAVDTGSAGPMGYLSALRRAQELDDRNAAVARLGQSGEQFAETMSRGAYRASPLTPMPSEVSKEEKRRQAVADYLKQQREGRETDANIAYKDWLRTHTKPPPPTKPGLTQEQIDAEHGLKLTDLAGRIAARGKPRGSGASKPTDTGPKLNKAAETLRKEFNGLPVVKAYNEVDSYYRKMVAAEANPSPAGDISLVFNFMKLQDPGSTVMQGEQADARNAGGVDERVRAAYNRVISGQTLTPEQRKDFVTNGRSAFATHAEQLNAAAERYAGIAKKSGADPEDVVIRPPSGGKKPESGSGLTSEERKKRLEELRAKKAAGTLEGR